jgi:sigma-B regulation protein RsbU (phosphoserine phosphatase)
MEQVEHALTTGALRSGDELPAVRPLAEALVISPRSVAKAYQALEAKGVLLSGRISGIQPTPSRPFAGATRVGIRLDRDLETAREVQQRLFPQDCPAVAGLDYSGLCRAAMGIGGDYYDFFRLGDTVLGLALGDVSGKGTPAALLMATLRADVRSQAMRRPAALAELAVNLNRLVYDCSPANRYATLFYGEYDAPARRLRYVNAGHNPPVLVRSHSTQPRVVRLATTGPVIGMMPGCEYTEAAVTLEPGDVLVAFSDGITEAMNEDGEEWGDERLTALVARQSGITAARQNDAVFHAVDAFAGRAPQHDDMTLVTIRVLPREDR